MNIQDEIVRPLIRGLAWNVTRVVPWWIAAIVLVILFLAGAGK